MTSGDDESDESKGIMPSAFMRALRPELYSDSQGRTDYQLDAPLLEYHLETLTKRNQTHDFEIFCCKLCARVICPNLRSQTGPDGGGDSKADAESYPVAEEVSDLFYEGEPNVGQERWGFAFSAKEKWQQKVRDDVRGLVATGRNYDRIICVTAMFAKSKQRAKLEEELSAETGVSVTIHDRTWIVEEVVDRGRKDIAFNYLGVGAEVFDASLLGPTDYSRQQQLNELERSLSDTTAYRGIEQHRVVDALLAAKLARGLEMPRVDIDGRFERAIRLADKHGNLYQRIEARYEQIWTAYWWFDDFEFLDRQFTAVEQLADEASHAQTLGFLVNLMQILFNSVIHGHLDLAVCKLDARSAHVRDLLQPMAADAERPNNRLEAEAALCHLDMNAATLAGDAEALSRIWRRFSDILDRADGMGEFDAPRMTKLIEVAEGVAGDDPAYSALIDKLSEFVTARTGEAQGALILLRRAEKLELTRHFEMIRLLSKAAMQLTKKEHSGELVDALSRLTIAYRSAGLLWAARATCIFALSTMAIETEAGDLPPPRFVLMAKLWASISLDLHHLPDFVVAMVLLRSTTEVLPLAEDDRGRLRRNALDMEMISASRILNLPDDQVVRLAGWPDVLDANQIYMPRTAALFALGYEGLLREEGSIPAQESQEEALGLLVALASQPAGQAGRSARLILNTPNAPLTLTTKLLGMRVDVRVSGSDHSILVAEAIVGSLEAFFATTIDHGVIPHTEDVTIDVAEDAGAIEPRFDFDPERMLGTLTWPSALPPTRYGDQSLIRRSWLDIASQLLGSAFIVPDAERAIGEILDGERAFGRMLLVTNSANSYHRLTSRYLTRPGDLIEGEVGTYAPLEARPTIERVDLKAMTDKGEGPAGEDEEREPAADSHRDMGVRSIIDLHLWDRAGWRGAGFAENEPGYPPFLALLFKQEDAARKIFVHWRERIGPFDEQDRIRLSVIRNVSESDPFRYSIQLSANAMPGDMESGQKVGFVTRSLVVEPKSHENIENFLANYRRFRAYYLIPAVWDETMGKPRFLVNVPVLKRQLNVFDAADVTDRHIEAVAIRQARED